MTTIMRGATTVRGIINDFLEAELPALILAARTDWNQEDWMLPLPVQYNAYDPMSASVYPIVGSYVRTTRNWSRTEVDASAQEHYEARYAVTVFTWVRTPHDGQNWARPEKEAAMLLRDDMIALVRSCILAKPSLGNPLCRVDETTITEDYLEPLSGQSQSPQWKAGGLISFELQIEEADFQVALGTANTMTVTVQKTD